MTRSRSLLFLAALFAAMFAALTAGVCVAADDPSIKGDLRQGIHDSMQGFIAEQTIEGVFSYYDPVTGELLQLKQPKLHDGIVRKGDFYVSCADFVDQNGRKLDFDFMVRPAGKDFRTVQALLHKIDGTKRPYALEDE